MQQKTPKKRFRLFDSQREGPGVLKNERPLKYDFYSYFVRMGRNMNKLLTVNILYVVGNFPLFFLIAALAGLTNVTSSAPNSLLFPALHGVMLHDEVGMLPLFGVLGGQAELSAYSTGTYVLFGLSALTVFTFGPVNAGNAYILRNIVSGEPVFVWSDFWYAVKRNWKQSMIYGVLDSLILVILSYDFLFFLKNFAALPTSVLFYATIACALIYGFMRFYLYIMMVTFDLSIFKLIKNALIFSILGFGRNLLALIGIAVIFLLNLFLFVYIPGLGIALPFVITVALMSYTSGFVAYYKIKDIMIDPYYTKEETPAEEE